MAVVSIVLTVNSTVTTPASIVVGIQGPQGAAGPTGNTGAAGAAGSDGAAGSAGANGSDGLDGSRFYYGTTAPADGLGADDDFYLDTSAGNVWTHGGSTGWNFSVNLIGPQGATGAAGTQVYGGTGAPADALGVDGDWYFDTASGDLYQHGGSAGWNMSINLRGPQGATGAAGAQGVQGIQGPTGATGATGPAGSDANVALHEAASDPHPQYRPGVNVYEDANLIASRAESLEFVSDDFTTSVNSDGSVNVGLQNVVKPNVSRNLTKGYTATAHDLGTLSSGTTTPSPANGAMQKAINGGAHTLAPPSTGEGNAASVVIQYTNNGSAGAVTTSGFTKVSGSFTTTNGDDFMCYCTVIGAFSHLNIVALQ